MPSKRKKRADGPVALFTAPEPAADDDLLPPPTRRRRVLAAAAERGSTEIKQRANRDEEQVALAEACAPQTFRDLDLSPDVRASLETWVGERLRDPFGRSLPVLLLTGGSGSGKTTTARLLLEARGCRVRVFTPACTDPASSDGVAVRFETVAAYACQPRDADGCPVGLVLDDIDGWSTFDWSSLGRLVAATPNSDDQKKPRGTAEVRRGQTGDKEEKHEKKKQGNESEADGERRVLAPVVMTASYPYEHRALRGLIQRGRLLVLKLGHSKETMRRRLQDALRLRPALCPALASADARGALLETADANLHRLYSLLDWLSRSSSPSEPVDGRKLCTYDRGMPLRQLTLRLLVSEDAWKLLPRLADEAAGDEEGLLALVWHNLGRLLPEIRHDAPESTAAAEAVAEAADLFADCDLLSTASPYNEATWHWRGSRDDQDGERDASDVNGAREAALLLACIGVPARLRRPPPRPALLAAGRQANFRAEFASGQHWPAAARTLPRLRRSLLELGLAHGAPAPDARLTVWAPRERLLVDYLCLKTHRPLPATLTAVSRISPGDLDKTPHKRGTAVVRALVPKGGLATLGLAELAAWDGDPTAKAVEFAQRAQRLAPHELSAWTAPDVYKDAEFARRDAALPGDSLAAVVHAACFGEADDLEPPPPTAPCRRCPSSRSSRAHAPAHPRISPSPPLEAPSVALEPVDRIDKALRQEMRARLELWASLYSKARGVPPGPSSSSAVSSRLSSVAGTKSKLAPSGVSLAQPGTVGSRVQSHAATGTPRKPAPPPPRLPGKPNGPADQRQQPQLLGPPRQPQSDRSGAARNHTQLQTQALGAQASHTLVAPFAGRPVTPRWSTR